MRNAETILRVHQERGSKNLPLERVYKHLFNPELFLAAYGRIYRNDGATTKGATSETVDAMSLEKIQNIIDLLRQEKYVWTPVRRTEIPKANGKTRPLGIPTWGDKLVQEVVRALLEAYYEPKFSEHSHGFRPSRGCHTALKEIQKTWKGTIWFIEGDIKGCFDNINHDVLIEIIQRDIQDGRLIGLIRGLLEAGYMEDWKYYDTYSGTPQGGIISPLLANIYMNEMDRFVKDTLIPDYTKGQRRKADKQHQLLTGRIRKAKLKQDFKKVAKLVQLRRQHPSGDMFDPNYRRLRFIRYADDFLLGFAGPKNEAEEIKNRLAEFLDTKLKLTLSKEKTVITHAVDEKAKFLGYEINVVRQNDLIAENGLRATNGRISLMMPHSVVQKIRTQYSREGKVLHRKELVQDDDYTIIQNYQSIYRGLYNYYCMATNVAKRMIKVKWHLETSLTKTLAHKHRCKVSAICKKYRTDVDGYKVLQVVVERPDKKPLVAKFGGIPLVRNADGLGNVDFRYDLAGRFFANERSEVVQRLLAGKCELCGAEGKVQMHHIRKLADLEKKGQRPKEEWQKIMSARRRKTLAVCEDCHIKIHSGKYDGTKIRQSDLPSN